MNRVQGEQWGPLEVKKPPSPSHEGSDWQDAGATDAGATQLTSSLSRLGQEKGPTSFSWPFSHKLQSHRSGALP